MFFQGFKTFLLLLLAILVIFLQFSFIPTLPVLFWSINLPLAMILVFLIFFSPHEALMVGLFFGFMMDSWHFSPFGVYLLSFLVVIFLAQLILTNWLTDRSLYSFVALAAICALIFSVTWSFLNFLFLLGNSDGLFFLFSRGFLEYTLLSVPWLMLICGSSYVFLSLISRRLKPVFLNKR